MKTYVVEAAVTYGVELTVLAKSKEEAGVVATEAILNGDGEASMVYDYEIENIRREKKR